MLETMSSTKKDLMKRRRGAKKKMNDEDPLPIAKELSREKAFKPKVNSSFNSNLMNGYLQLPFELRLTVDLERRRKAKLALPEEPPKPSTPTTNIVFDKMVARRGRELFISLGGDVNSRLVLSNADIDSISVEKLKILFPLLSELDDNNISLSLDRFIQIFKTFIINISPEERKTLLEIGKARIDFEPKEETFTPTINPRSDQIARALNGEFELAHIRREKREIGQKEEGETTRRFEYSIMPYFETEEYDYCLEM